MNGKRLYKADDDKVISGVCSGLAEYFDIDPVLMRIIWIVGTVLLFAVGFIGVIGYIILAVILPTKTEVQSQMNENRGQGSQGQSQGASSYSRTYDANYTVVDENAPTKEYIDINGSEKVSADYGVHTEPAGSTSGASDADGEVHSQGFGSGGQSGASDADGEVHSQGFGSGAQSGASDADGEVHSQGFGSGAQGAAYSSADDSEGASAAGRTAYEGNYDTENKSSYDGPEIKDENSGRRTAIALGVVLIIMGTVFLFRQFIPWIDFGLVVAAGIIALGIYFIVHKASR